MMQTVDAVLAAASLYTDNELYALIRLPPQAIIAAAGIIAEMNTAFSALLLDKHEITLLVLQDALSDFEKRLQGAEIAVIRYRLITLDVPLEPGLVGFIGRISTVLAEAGVSILSYAAFKRDHLFIPAEDFDVAWAALQRLTQDLK
ncbi:ACT domain-containing protein [bacterium]|nr:ACT domain-containing protein [bacterium]